MDIEQQGFIEGEDITGNLILVKDIIEYYNEEDLEAYIIMMNLRKVYNRIDREILEVTMREIIFGENLIEMVKLLYKQAEAVIITNDIKGKPFRT